MMGPEVQIRNKSTRRTRANGTVFFAPVPERPPFVFARHVEEVAYDGQTLWAGGKANPSREKLAGEDGEQRNGPSEEGDEECHGSELRASRWVSRTARHRRWGPFNMETNVQIRSRPWPRIQLWTGECRRKRR